jgi:hypothetical protein
MEEFKKNLRIINSATSSTEYKGYA